MLPADSPELKCFVKTCDIGRPAERAETALPSLWVCLDDLVDAGVMFVDRTHPLDLLQNIVLINDLHSLSERTLRLPTAERH